MNFDTYNNVDKSLNNCAEWNKPDTKDYVVHDSIYMKS